MSEKAIVAFIFDLPPEEDHLGLQKIVGPARSLYEDRDDVVVKLAIRNQADRLLTTLDPENYPSVMPLPEESVNRFVQANDLESLIFMLAGATSMCWARVDRAGVFDPDKAKAFCEQALLRLGEIGREKIGSKDLVDIGPEAFTNGEVISYKGDNYYRACDTLVTHQEGNGGKSFCVKRIGHPGKLHEDYYGNMRSEDVDGS